jgi:hypothetical protein
LHAKKIEECKARFQEFSKEVIAVEIRKGTGWRCPRVLVTGALATVDVQNFSRDERRGIKEQNRMGDIAHLSRAPERMKGTQRFMSFWCVHWRLDDPRRDGIDANAFPGVLNRKRLRGGVQTTLRQGCHEFRYLGRPLPALKSFDRRDRVIYCNTSSKVIFPRLRLAYVVVPHRAVERVGRVARSINAGSPTLLQAAMADFIGQGHGPSRANVARVSGRLTRGPAGPGAMIIGCRHWMGAPRAPCCAASARERTIRFRTISANCHEASAVHPNTTSRILFTKANDSAASRSTPNICAISTTTARPARRVQPE